MHRSASAGTRSLHDLGAQAGGLDRRGPRRGVGGASPRGAMDSPTSAVSGIRCRRATRYRRISTRKAPLPTSRTSWSRVRTASTPTSPSATPVAEPVAQLSSSDASCLAPSPKTACFAADGDASRLCPGSSNPLAPTDRRAPETERFPGLFAISDLGRLGGSLPRSTGDDLRRRATSAGPALRCKICCRSRQRIAVTAARR